MTPSSDETRPAPASPPPSGRVEPLRPAGAADAAGSPAGPEVLDLYAVLGIAPDLPIPAVRARVGELYNEALANAEHRDLRKRRHYDRMLELLPRCYDILLDEQKRALYDAYLVQARAGLAQVDFDTYMAQVSGKVAFDLRSREGLMAVRQSDPAEPGPEPAPMARPNLRSLGGYGADGTEAKPDEPELEESFEDESGELRPVVMRGDVMYVPVPVAAPARGPQKPAMAAVISPLAGIIAFVVGLVVVRGVLCDSLPAAFVAGLVAGGAATGGCYFVMKPK